MGGGGGGRGPPIPGLSGGRGGLPPDDLMLPPPTLRPEVGGGGGRGPLETEGNLNTCISPIMCAKKEAADLCVSTGSSPEMAASHWAEGGEGRCELDRGWHDTNT